MRVRAMVFPTANEGNLIVMWETDNNTMLFQYIVKEVEVEIPLTLKEAEALKNCIPIIAGS